MELKKQIKTLGGKLDKGKIKLAEVAGASEDSWVSIKEGVEAIRVSMKAAFSDAAAKFKK